MTAPLPRAAEQHLVSLTRAGDRAAADTLLRSLDALLRRAAPRGRALAAVQGRERRIVRARLVTLHTGVEAGSLREVGAALGCSHQHVRDVEAAALGRMRVRLGC